MAGSLRLAPGAPPAARAVTHPDVGALFQPGAVIAVCVRPEVPPPMPRPDARNLDSPGAHLQRVPQGDRLAAWQQLHPRVDPLDHNGSCNCTRTGEEICDPVGGATMLPPHAGVPCTPVKKKSMPFRPSWCAKMDGTGTGSRDREAVNRSTYR